LDKIFHVKDLIMRKAILSLNFMYCMERFATQIYLTQKGAFKGLPFPQQLTDAAENERTHVLTLQADIKRLKGRIFPFGWLFQFMGFILGLVTRLIGKQNLFRADTFVETRAVKDYGSFLKAVHFDAETNNIIRKIVADEETHILNWQKARESVITRQIEVT
jgi:demethoxyubiquinone hydroxylase (CLK1/Coq7/Cat5 family)